jgi:hypothetical protein
MKYGKKLKIGDAHVTQEISKKYKPQSLGMPKAPLLHQQKYQIIFQDTIFLLLHMLCVFLGASLFLLSVLFFLYATIKGWTPTYFFWRRHTPFSLPRTL